MSKILNIKKIAKRCNDDTLDICHVNIAIKCIKLRMWKKQYEIIEHTPISMLTANYVSITLNSFQYRTEMLCIHLFHFYVF